MATPTELWLQHRSEDISRSGDRRLPDLAWDVEHQVRDRCSRVQIELLHDTIEVRAVYARNVDVRQLERDLERELLDALPYSVHPRIQIDLYPV